MKDSGESQAEMLRQGIRLFNSGQYFECHEVLEDLWNMQPEPERQFTQGIIQIAVGCYHLGRANVDGAVKLFTRGLARVRQFTPEHANCDVAGLIAQVERLLLDRKMTSPPQISSSQSRL